MSTCHPPTKDWRVTSSQPGQRCQEGISNRNNGDNTKALLTVDEKCLDPRPAGTETPQPIDNDTPITKLYLNFDTILPSIALARSSPSDLPPAPDLGLYTNPMEWPTARKNTMLGLSCIAMVATGYTAGSYSPPIPLMASEFGVSQLAVVTGITSFTAGFGLAPMVLAPFSEINGRYPVFVVAGFFYVAFEAVCGIVNNLAGMVVARFLCGTGGSVFSAMVGGLITDLWHKDERNTPMALFSGSVFIGTGLGPLLSSVIVQRVGGEGYEMTGPTAPWRWIFWHQAIYGTVLMLAITAFFYETRASVLLQRKADRLNRWYEKLEQRGVYGAWVPNAVTDQQSQFSSSVERFKAFQAPSRAQETSPRGLELQRIRWITEQGEHGMSVTALISASVSRPFHLLFTDSIIFYFSLWVSFAWAILYLTFGSIPLIFSRQYSFNIEQTGYVFASMVVGSILATALGIYQERLLEHPSWQHRTATTENRESKFWDFMRRRFPVEAPESRLYPTCITSVLLPIGLYLFGFTFDPSIHWIVPAIAIALATMGIYFIYLSTFNYFADSYQSYASSALASQSFCRNMLGGAFPLAVGPLFTNLGEDAAGGLLGAIATILTIIPWVLAFYGEHIRKRSKFAVSLEH
ncbi:major facilitator superfamily domain-containing protein [Ilyonectria destructans]|nr:major facilitator superfamily domain-containing protein [Ilyonectria destructans]